MTLSKLLFSLFKKQLLIIYKQGGASPLSLLLQIASAVTLKTEPRVEKKAGHFNLNLFFVELS